MTAGPPIVSVLVPVRDAARTLPGTLASLRAQSLSGWEAVIVDDGSIDGTSEILRREAEREPRFRLLRIERSGIETALNSGLTRCAAPFIARVDADDLMHYRRLELQVGFLRQDHTLAGVGSLVRCFPRTTLRDGLRRYEAWLNSLTQPAEIAAARFIESPLVHPSVMLRRDALEAVGGWRNSPWAEDWDLWLRMIEAGYRFAKVPEVLCFWRDHPGRLTRTAARYSREAMTEARAHYLTRGPLRDRESVVWGAGPIGKALLKALDRAGARVRALIDVDPKKIGQRVHNRRVLSPQELHAHTDAILLAAVGALGARHEIRQEAEAAGYVEGRTFFACA